MVIKVGINGFGRIGRVIFRTCHQNHDIKLSAINDPAIDVEYICYLIKFDSTHGKFNGIVLRCGDEIQVDDHRIKIFHEKLPLNIPWQEAGVQYVIEASGMFTTLEKASGHLLSDTVRRVIVTAPSIDVPMIILGVNDTKLSLDHKVLSCASSTLYCLAPIIKVLEDNFGVVEGFMTSIHAMTPSLKPLDGLCLKGKHWRDHRSIHQNIIPASTGACKALGKIIPDVKDKISGLAFRIPIVNVSVLDLSVRLSKNTTLQDIVSCVMAASTADMKNIIKISNEESVSSDFNGDSHSCILDVDSSLQQNTNFFKLICWYENEHSYACRVVDSILFAERQFYFTRLSPKYGNINTKLCEKMNEIKKSDTQKKEIIIDDGKKLTNQKSQGNASTIKQQQHRHIVLKKPTSSHNSAPASSNINAQDPKKRIEMFKIWNDTKETPIPNVRQKRGSIFHSSVSFPQQNVGTSDCNKGQERLQKVKREFSKMANITENLLKKSYINRMQLGAVVHDFKDTVKLNTTSDIDKENTLTENDNERKNKPIFHTCGDYKNKIEVISDKVIDVWCKEEMKTINNNYENCVSNCSNSQNESIVNFNCTPIQSESELNPKANITMIKGSCINKNSVSKVVDYTNDSRILEHNVEFKDEVAKTINTLIDGLAENFQIHVTRHEQGDTPIILNTNGINIDNENGDGVLNKSKVKNIGDNSSRVDILFLDVKDDVENTNNETIKGDIPTDENIFTHNNRKPEPIDNKGIQILRVTNEQFTKNNDHRKDVLLSKQILERLNRFVPEPVFLIPEDDVTVNTALNIHKIYVKQNKLDIYDKLDSVSASGSENSFEIHGRKSQIIDITDLTNSIDDLANLEKICKIIEISDELSDKLFSTLKKKDCNEINKEKWSFKDLCERLNLDEFCDKLFGKTI